MYGEVKNLYKAIINDLPLNMILATKTSGKNVDIVEAGTRNKYCKLLNESPVAKYLNVISNFILACTAIHILVSYF